MIGILLPKGREQSGRVASFLAEVSVLDNFRVFTNIMGFSKGGRYDPVVVIEPSVDPTMAGILADFRRADPDPPSLAWITQITTTNLNRIVDTSPSRVYSEENPSGEIARDLLNLRLGECGRDLVLAAVAHHAEWPKKLRQGIRLAVASIPPFPKVADLARAIGVDRSALEKAWRKWGSGEVELKQILNLLQVAFLARLEMWGLDQNAQARRCGIHLRTVERLADRYRNNGGAQGRVDRRQVWEQLRTYFDPLGLHFSDGRSSA